MSALPASNGGWWVHSGGLFFGGEQPGSHEHVIAADGVNWTRWTVGTGTPPVAAEGTFALERDWRMDRGPESATSPCPDAELDATSQRRQLIASHPVGWIVGVTRHRFEVTASNGAGEGAVFDLDVAVIGAPDGPSLVGTLRSTPTLATAGAREWAAEVELKHGRLDVWATGGDVVPVVWTSRLSGPDERAGLGAFGTDGLAFGAECRAAGARAPAAPATERTTGFTPNGWPKRCVKCDYVAEAPARAKMSGAPSPEAYCRWCSDTAPPMVPTTVYDPNLGTAWICVDSPRSAVRGEVRFLSP